MIRKSGYRFSLAKKQNALHGDHAPTIQCGFACSAWEGLPALAHRIAFGRSSDARDLRRRPGFGVTRRTNSSGHRDRRWLVSNSSFSSQDPDQCPARTKSRPSPRPARSTHRKEGEWPGRSRRRCCAHRFSGSGWHTVSAHCRSRYGGLMEGRVPLAGRCRLREREFVKAAGDNSQGVKRPSFSDSEGPRRTATVR